MRTETSAPTRSASVARAAPRSLHHVIAEGHTFLRAQRTPLGLRPSPPFLNETAARTAAYGDAWTCRTSSELLAGILRGRGVATVVDHVMPSFFAWPGEAQRVAYHYFVVDHPEQTRLLIDPTIYANGLAKPATQIVFQRLAKQLAERMGLRGAAEALTRRISEQTGSGLLILDDPATIMLFRAVVCALARGGNPKLPIRLR